MTAIYNNGYLTTTLPQTFYSSNLALVANENRHTLFIGKQKEKENLLVKQEKNKKRKTNEKHDPEKQSEKTFVDTIEKEERKCFDECLDPVQNYIAQQIALLEQCDVAEILEQEKLVWEQHERRKRKIKQMRNSNRKISDVFDSNEEEKNVNLVSSKLFLKKFAFDEEIRQCRWSNEEEGEEDEKTIIFMDEGENEQTLKKDSNDEVLYIYIFG